MLCLIVFLRELSGNLNRTEISEECLVQNSYFDNLGTLISEGGAIYKTTESALRILSSVFSFCSALNAGGAIKAVGGIFEVSGTCLYYCYVRTAQDAYHGNGLYVTSKSNIGLISFLRCGSSKDISGDSSIFVYSGPVVIETANFSCCDGTGGAASVFFYYLVSASSMSYSNVVNGTNACGIAIITVSYTTRYMNMLHLRCYWALNFVDCSPIYDSCLFFNWPCRRYIYFMLFRFSWMSLHNCNSIYSSNFSHIIRRLHFGSAPNHHLSKYIPFSLKISFFLFLVSRIKIDLKWILVLL